MDSFLDFEESIAGKAGGRWVNSSNNIIFSYLAISLALVFGIYGGMVNDILPNGFLEQLAKGEADGASYLNALIFGVISAIVITFAWWVTLTAIIKWTPKKSLTTAFLGIFSAWMIVIVVRGLSHFVLVEADWDVVWANRVLLIVGQQMTEQMTQAPGSDSCIATVKQTGECYGVNQNWRLWWILYPTVGIIASAYGTTSDRPAKFLIPFAVLCNILIFLSLIHI